MAAEVLGEKPVQVETRTKLREELNQRPSGGIIFTTIQKSVPGEDEDTFPVGLPGIVQTNPSMGPINTGVRNLISVRCTSAY